MPTTPELVYDLCAAGSDNAEMLFEFSAPGPFTMQALRFDAQATPVSTLAGRPCFGYVSSGELHLSSSERSFTSSQGREFYLADPTQWHMKGDTGCGLLIFPHERQPLTLGDNALPDHHVFEARGAPEAPKAGAAGDKKRLSETGPILEIATFNPGVQQKMHTHPTGRAVAMVSGSGTFEWFDAAEQKVRSMSVKEGMVFGWEPDVPHAFGVDASCEEPLVIYAFQADADTVNYQPKDMPANPCEGGA